jgi:class 3 adenylate cyclase
MEPQIRYAKTIDGVNIAFTVLGEGMPMVITSQNWGSVHLYTSGFPITRRTIDGLIAAGFRVIVYDGRGSGSSDRAVTDFSLESTVQDLEAVIERAELGRFALWSAGHSNPVAVKYAVQHPDCVSHLILVNGAASGIEYHAALPAVLFNIIQKGVQEEWELFTLALGNQWTGFADADAGRKYAEILRKGMTLGAFSAYEAAADEMDVTELLPTLTVPTLVVYDGSRGPNLKEVSQRLAQLIPDARFVLTDEPALAARDFVSEGIGQGQGMQQLPSGTAVILFADIVDSTGLTERLGDTAFRDKARGLDEAMRAAIRDNGGTAVEGKTLGDGVLAVFTSAKQAIACAQACHDAASAAGLSLHVGIHAGDVIRESDNVYGGAVNIAARVAAASAAGETLVSGTVRDLARTSAGVSFEDRGEQELKGVGDAVRVWAVRQA